jgi:hypothetical protein
VVVPLVLLEPVDPVTGTEAPAPPDAPLAPITSVEAVEAHRARKRDPLWDAIQTVWPRGPKTDKERDKWNAACFQLRKGGVTPDEILTAAQNWANVMGAATMTPMALASNLGLLLDGPQVGGRSTGTIREHRQQLRETVTARVSSRALIEATRAADARARGGGRQGRDRRDREER